MAKINDYMGERVTIEFKDGKLGFGTLVFYNWDQQIIHISDYEINIPDTSDVGYEKKCGRFVVINSHEWKTVSVM